MRLLFTILLFSLLLAGCQRQPAAVPATSAEDSLWNNMVDLHQRTAGRYIMANSNLTAPTVFDTGSGELWQWVSGGTTGYWQQITTAIIPKRTSKRPD